jgi:hypothetical protein
LVLPVFLFRFGRGSPARDSVSSLSWRMTAEDARTSLGTRSTVVGVRWDGNVVETVVSWLGKVVITLVVIMLDSRLVKEASVKSGVAAVILAVAVFVAP